jgi:hypothetical protein
MPPNALCLSTDHERNERNPQAGSPDRSARRFAHGPCLFLVFAAVELRHL